MRSVVENNGGIAALPDFLTIGETEQTGLVHILPEHEAPVINAYFVYPEEMRSTKRIKVMRDFLVKKIAQSQFDRSV